jgi:hypothetical protein
LGEFPAYIASPGSLGTLNDSEVRCGTQPAAANAPVYSEGGYNSLELQSVTSVFELMLREHDPCPAVVLDRYWNVVMTNQSAPRFFNCLFS